MLSVKKNMEGIVRRKGGVYGGKPEGEMNHERLWTLSNRGFWKGDGWALGKPGGGY